MNCVEKISQGIYRRRATVRILEHHCPLSTNNAVIQDQARSILLTILFCFALFDHDVVDVWAESISFWSAVENGDGVLLSTIHGTAFGCVRD